jgi:hypothetical protein
MKTQVKTSIELRDSKTTIKIWMGLFALTILATHSLHAETGSSTKSEAPAIEARADGMGELKLGKTAEDALKKFDANLVLLKSEDFTQSIQDMFQDDIPGQTPVAIVGDLNGDKIQDAVVMGKNKTKILTVALMSEKSGSYQAKKLAEKPLPVKMDKKDSKAKSTAKTESDQELQSQDETGLTEYLGLVPAIHRGPKAEQGEKRFENDAVRIENFRGASRLLYYKNGKFQEWR